MNKIKKIIFFIHLFTILIAIPFLAQSQTAELTNPLAGRGDGVNGLINLLNQLIKFALGFVGLLSLIAFIYGGILWMISFGDAKKVQKGKDVMIWSIFGLLVIFASYGIVLALFQALGVSK